MEKFLKFLFFVFILSLIPGQLTRFELGIIPAAFYLHDLILVVLIILSSIYFFAIKCEFKFAKGIIFVLIFILAALVSQINSFRFFSLPQIVAGNLFLIRFVAFFWLYLIFYNLISKKNLNFWFYSLITVGVVLAILGFLQLAFFFDLRFLTNFGYDPHFGRLVSTFLDPNFFGGFQVLILNLALAKFLAGENKKLIFVIVILFASVVLTFSRSSYLALIISIFLFGILKSKKLAIVAFSIFVLLTPIIPRMLDRILGAVTLDVTAVARIQSWLEAFQIFSFSPILGIGFNNLRFARAQLGFFEISQGLGGHSGAGVDSAFLQVLVTTGILGFLAFGSFYFYFVVTNFKNWKTNFYSLTAFVSLIALFFHSQFVNSLFFPWISAIFWLTIAMADVAKNSSK